VVADALRERLADGVCSDDKLGDVFADDGLLVAEPPSSATGGRANRTRTNFERLTITIPTVLKSQTAATSDSSKKSFPKAILTSPIGRITTRVPTGMWVYGIAGNEEKGGGKAASGATFRASSGMTIFKTTPLLGEQSTKLPNASSSTAPEGKLLANPTTLAVERGDLLLESSSPGAAPMPSIAVLGF
jgi:hypothetical protein